MMKDALLVPRSIPFFSHDRFASKVVFSNQLGINSPHPQHQVIEEERAGEIMRFYIFSILESFFPLQHSLFVLQFSRLLFFQVAQICFSAAEEGTCQDASSLRQMTCVCKSTYVHNLQFFNYHLIDCFRGDKSVSSVWEMPVGDGLVGQDKTEFLMGS